MDWCGLVPWVVSFEMDWFHDFDLFTFFRRFTSVLAQCTLVWQLRSHTVRAEVMVSPLGWADAMGGVF